MRAWRSSTSRHWRWRRSASAWLGVDLAGELPRRGGQGRLEATVADSRQELLCAWLSAILLVGLLVNATFGWSWADQGAALVIAAVALREGRG